MPYTLRVNDYLRASSEEQSEMLGSVRRALSEDPTPTIHKCLRLIEGFEEDHGFSSEMMLRKLSEGKLSETEAISNWSQTLRKLQHLRSLPRSPDSSGYLSSP